MCTNARIALHSLAALAAAWLLAPAAAPAQSDSSATVPPAGALPPPSQAPPATQPSPASGNLLNPNVSVIGWFQAEAGRSVDRDRSEIFMLREAEIGLQAAVDPYSRADFFIAVSPEEGASLEEGYLTILSLPAGLSAKLGKFRNNLGRFNRIHPGETPFADRPLAAEEFFGEEGLATEGVSASWLIPNPVALYLNWDVEATRRPDEGGLAIHGGGSRDLLYTTRLGTFIDLGEAANLTLGASYANGPAGYADPAPGDSTDLLRAGVWCGDITFRWKNPRRAIYRSLVLSAEAMTRSAETSGGRTDRARGGFAYVDWQAARRWHAGGRYDWTDLGATSERGDPLHTGGLVFLTFTPSEFSLLSLQARYRETDGPAYFLKSTFSIGPHGAHPF